MILPAIDLSKLGVGTGTIPFTTKHILEARAILVQVSYIEALTDTHHASLYWKRIRDGGLKDRNLLEYTLGLCVISGFVRNFKFATYHEMSDLCFNILDLSLHGWHEPKGFEEIYPPIIFLGVLQEIQLFSRDKKSIDSEEIVKFIKEKSIFSPKRDLVIKKNIDFIKNQINFHSSGEHFLNMISNDFSKICLEFVNYRLNFSANTLSPKKLVNDIRSGNCPKPPLVIDRESSFEELTLFLNEDNRVYRWFLHNWIFSEILYSNKIQCPLKKYKINCHYKTDNCGDQNNFFQDDKEVCSFGYEINNFGL